MNAPLIRFGDLAREYRELQADIDAAVARVLQSGWFVLGPEVEAFEHAFAEWLGAKHVVGVASGTEAIALALMAAEVGPGDKVITVAHTAVPTISAISMIGATPRFVDIDPATCLMDVAQVEEAITPSTRAIVPVHLYGQCVDMDSLLAVADRHAIPVIEDCAQATGAMCNGRMAGTMGRMGCFSFYPSKNLGCYGDGGAVSTNDDSLAERLRMLRNYGQSKRYHHDIKGINSRLDEVQAAILSAKLPHVDAWNDRRKAIASRYREGLSATGLTLPAEREAGAHVYHLFAVQSENRETIMRALANSGVQTLIHYPIPAHRQKAYLDLSYAVGSLPNTEHVASRVFSLPLYPQLTDAEVERVIRVTRDAAGEGTSAALGRS